MNNRKIIDIIGYVMARVIVYIWILVLIIILFMQTVSGQSINPGACYTQNFYSPLNQTLNTSINICALNQTRHKINFTIQPGANYYVNRTYCEVIGSCTTNLTHANKCIVDDDAEPGDKYNYQTAVCDVRIDIEDCPDSDECGEGLPTRFTEEYQIQYSNQSKRIQFNFKDQERIWSIEDNINIKATIEYICPTSVVNSSVGAKVTAEQCRALGEVYCGEAFDLMTRKADEAIGRSSEYEAKLENCRLEVKSMQENSICVSNDEYAKIKSENFIISNETIRCSEDKGILNYQNKELSSNITALGIALAFSIMINSYQYFNGKKLDKGSKLG